jgi:hypothetical protein
MGPVDSLCEIHLYDRKYRSRATVPDAAIVIQGEMKMVRAGWYHGGRKRNGIPECVWKVDLAVLADGLSGLSGM